MKINWNKGLHRLFIIGVVCWFIYILLVYPINIIQTRQSSSLNLLSLEESMVYDIENEDERKRKLSDIDKKKN